jgi:hypothetical protein
MAPFTLTLPRFIGVVLLALLATATLTFAAEQRLAAPAVPAATAPAAAQEPATLVVPDVTGQAYVFAKGTLEDAGFAWRVAGTVPGYAANDVATQAPAAGTRLKDTGAPVVTLTLAANSGYSRAGTPESSSPYRGTAVVLAGAKPKPVAQPKPALRAKPAAKAKPIAQPKPAADTNPYANTKIVVKAKRLPNGKSVVTSAKLVPAKAAPKKRPAAFAVAGAPKEPLDEITLPDRALRLSNWLDKHPRPTDANVQHWLYQHSWIVSGARFGWWRGEEALRILIDVDHRVERTWEIGAKSRAVAEQALREVEARS